MLPRSLRCPSFGDGAERIWVGPGELPAPPYHKIAVRDYLRPTFLGRRSGVYQSSIGCPYACNFCGVISVFGRKEKVQAPSRTAGHLRYLIREHGMDSVHFYDNNFFPWGTWNRRREIADPVRAARPEMVGGSAGGRGPALFRRYLAAAASRQPASP